MQTEGSVFRSIIWIAPSAIYSDPEVLDSCYRTFNGLYIYETLKFPGIFVLYAITTIHIS